MLNGSEDKIQLGLTFRSRGRRERESLTGKAVGGAPQLGVNSVDYVYLCGVQTLPVKALTTFVIGDLRYKIGQIKLRC
jgi:hypothetical protein